MERHASRRNQYPQDHQSAGAEGWANLGGGSHDKFKHDARPGVIIVVPRHRSLSLGVARSIAKLAGWD